MNWFDSLPPADTTVPCGAGTHTVRWEAGRLTLLAHPDAEAEAVLGALGGDKPGCVTLAETWARHADDLAVLNAGPRGDTDRVSVGWAEVAELRRRLPPGQAGKISRTSPGPAVTAPSSVVARPGGRVRAGPTGPGAVGQLVTPGMAGFGMEDFIRRQLAHIELLELLALGPEFQFRLAGTVTSAWSGPDRAQHRASRRPELAGVLTGRFAPSARQWLGIDPDAVTVSLHEGPGWGSMQATGAGSGRRLRAALPLGWLAEVWACGLAVLDGYLVVAVQEPGYPMAGVLALPAPDAEPVRLVARATGSPERTRMRPGEVGPAGAGTSGGLPSWTL